MPYTGSNQVNYTQTLQLLLDQKGGQLVNETWSNIGIRWEPQGPQGGLELYVNAEKVGHAIRPLDRPEDDVEDDNNAGTWVEMPTLTPVYTNRTWRYVAMTPPIAMIGCHRTSDGVFRDFCKGIHYYIIIL